MSATYPSSTDTSLLKQSLQSSISNHDFFSWDYFRNIARERYRELVLAHVVALLAVISSVPIPLLMPLLVDEVLLDKPAQWLAFLNSFTPESWQGPVLYIVITLIITVMLRFTMIVLNVWQTLQFTNVAKDITYRMRRALLQRLQSVSMGEYETLGSGTVTSHFVTDINDIDVFIGKSISKALVAGLTLIGITIVLFWMHWPLALFIMLLNPLVIYFTVLLGKRVKGLKRKENTAFELFQQALTETLDGIHQIRASNREHHYIRAVVDKAHDIKISSAKFSWKSDVATRLSMGVFLLGFDIFRAISMVMVLFADLTIGQMMAVFGYLWFMMAPVEEMLNIQIGYFSAKAALARINKLARLHVEPQYPHIHDPFLNQHTVALRIENLSFSYHISSDKSIGEDDPIGLNESKRIENSENILKGVNLSIAKGEKVALVGASGGGKSTLVQVILGMYSQQSGQLYFNEIPVNQIGLDIVRENVATVLQHPPLFNDSVKMNLSLGQERSDKELWKVLEVAQLDQVIKEMPSGLQTIIGRQGIRLSGGQRQRLAIARMLLSDPKVVILDEATSALDTLTEIKLHKALNEFLQDRTTLIIAHRLSAVRQANRVYVFEDGHIIEEGSHEDLIQNNGLYSRLYRQSPT
jgi:ATP-binding cassette subfamily C protein